MEIKNGSIVSIHYKLKNEAGLIVNASTDGEPLVFQHGTGAIIPGLEKELTGKKTADEFSVEIQPEDGYGEVNPCLYSVLNKEAFSGIENLEPGMQFQAQDENGNSQIIRVMSVEGDEITVDRNHPLAGRKLFFDISIISVEVDITE